MACVLDETTIPVGLGSRLIMVWLSNGGVAVSFTDLEIKREYRSLLQDVVQDFYAPLLSQAVLYRRAVGFFSSSALICLTGGIKGLLENDGKIEIIASPRLSEDDAAAIRDGIQRRDDVILAALLRELDEPKGKFEQARLNLLSNLIAADVMTIKIAFLERNGEIGMFHEKLGLMADREGNTVAFSGSMNETENAFHCNYESIDVYTSWSRDADRVNDKVAAFDAMWGDYEPGITVVDFPKVSEAIIQKYKISDGIDLTSCDCMPDSDHRDCQSESAEEDVPRLPSWFREGIRDYQREAIDNWEAAGFRGVFDMATGTGKTLTALGAICRLSDAVKHNLAVIIVCPYQHLVEQWKDDIVSFGMKPIVCHSASKQKNWKARVKNAVGGFKLGVIKRFCIVTTNATFETSYMQEQIGKLTGNCLIVADEAHNLGAAKATASLPGHFPFRLGLSATIERHGDDEGTRALFDFFGDKCIKYSLEDAIRSHMLTPYYYHPLYVYLDSDELERYVEISKEIAKAVASSSGTRKKELSDYAKMLLIKRAAMIAGANGKLLKLKEAMRPYAEKKHILVYCGSTSIQDPGYVEGDPGDSEIRQIDAVSAMLGNELHMKISQFTSRENADKRAILQEEFSSGKQMQALVAIRCLDEGVNIPSIETAFILASSTNPKEYVQRRGRVLRLAEGKAYATIFDFITLPMSVDDIGSYSIDVVNSSKSLVARELARMKDFAAIAENPAEALNAVTELSIAFGVDPDNEEEEYV